MSCIFQLCDLQYTPYKIQNSVISNYLNCTPWAPFMLTNNNAALQISDSNINRLNPVNQ